MTPDWALWTFGLIVFTAIWLRAWYWLWRLGIFRHG